MSDQSSEQEISRIGSAMRHLRQLGEELNSGSMPANLAEQIWDQIDEMAAAFAMLRLPRVYQEARSEFPCATCSVATWCEWQRKCLAEHTAPTDPVVLAGSEPSGAK